MDHYARRGAPAKEATTHEPESARRGGRYQHRGIAAPVPAEGRLRGVARGRRRQGRRDGQGDPARPCAARYHAARDGRLAGLPRAAQDHENAHHHAHRQGRDRGQGLRSGDGRGRLHRQALRGQGAACARARRAAPHRRRRQAPEQEAHLRQARHQPRLL